MEVIGDIFKNVFVYLCTYVYLQLIHVEVWQKTKKFYKAIILQLKNKFKKKECFGGNGDGQFSVSSRKKEEMETVIKDKSM